MLYKRSDVGVPDGIACAIISKLMGPWIGLLITSGHAAHLKNILPNAPDTMKSAAANRGKGSSKKN